MVFSGSGVNLMLNDGGSRTHIYNNVVEDIFKKYLNISDSHLQINVNSRKRNTILHKCSQADEEEKIFKYIDTVTEIDFVDCKNCIHNMLEEFCDSVMSTAFISVIKEYINKENIELLKNIKSFAIESLGKYLNALENINSPHEDMSKYSDYVFASSIKEILYKLAVDIYNQK